MSAELDQQLTDFLLTNRNYNRQFTGDLINILKCHLGEHVKKIASLTIEGTNLGCYCLLTDNFIGYTLLDNYLFSLYLMHKDRIIFTTNIINSDAIPDFYVGNDNIETAKSYFNQGKLTSFRSGLHYHKKDKVHDVDIDWLFTRIPTKSARN